MHQSGIASDQAAIRLSRPPGVSTVRNRVRNEEHTFAAEPLPVRAWRSRQATGDNRGPGPRVVAVLTAGVVAIVGLFEGDGRSVAEEAIAAILWR